MGAKILVIVWIAFGAFFLTVTPNIAVAQEKIPGLNDSDFQQALVDWLDGDTESLSVFAVLAKEGNSAATVLLARSSLFYLGRRDMKPFQPFIDALNMDAAPTSPAEVTRYLRQFLKTQTATVKALLDSTLYQEKWWILDESVDKTSMIATLMESGEIKIAVKFMSDEDLELYSQKYELPEFKKVRLWINAGLHQLKHIDSQVKLIEFANAWQKKRVTAYFVLPSLTYPLNQAHTYLSRPISELDMMVAVLVAGAERYAVLDTPLSKRGLQYRAALVPYTWTLKTADEFEPLRQVCDTLCPSDHLNCMRALNSMNEGAERMLRFSTPSEIIIPDQMFLKSQVAEDVFMRSNYYDRPSKLLSDDIYPEELAKGGGRSLLRLNPSVPVLPKESSFCTSNTSVQPAPHRRSQSRILCFCAWGEPAAFFLLAPTVLPEPHPSGTVRRHSGGRRNLDRSHRRHRVGFRGEQGLLHDGPGALTAPARQIVDNAGEDGAVIVGKMLESKDTNWGFDAQNGEFVDLVKAGIIDPAKVVRSALQDAASVAGLLVTTEAMIADKPEPKCQGGGGMPDMGGMGGMGGMM